MHARTFVSVVACLTLPMLAAAQDGQLQLPAFSQLQQKATGSVDVKIGRFGLWLASLFIDSSDPDEAQVKKTIAGLKSVRIRSYKFSSDLVYSQGELDTLRQQLSEPGWSPLVQVRDQKEDKDVDVYVSHDEHSAKGLAIIVAAPRELTILNIVGQVELNQIAALRRTFEPHKTEYAQTDAPRTDPPN